MIYPITYIDKTQKQRQATVFKGKTYEQMPELLKRGLIPLSMKDFMILKVNDWNYNTNSSNPFRDFKFKICYNTSDSIIYHPNGNIKVVTNSPTLRSVNPDSKLAWYGSLKLPEGTFNKTEGVEFTKKDIKKYTDPFYDHIKEKDAITNPFWIALARGDKNLLKEYAKIVYKKNKKMGVVVMDKCFLEKLNFEAERHWCHRDGDCINSSDYLAALNYHNGHLVGVTAEARASIAFAKPQIQLEKFLE